METVTEALQSSVDFQVHLKGLETAQKLLLMSRSVKLQSVRYLNDSKIQWISPAKKELYLIRSEIANNQYKRLNKYYKRQLFNLFYKSKF